MNLRKLQTNELKYISRAFQVVFHLLQIHFELGVMIGKSLAHEEIFQDMTNFGLGRFVPKTYTNWYIKTPNISEEIEGNHLNHYHQDSKLSKNQSHVIK